MGINNAAQFQFYVDMSNHQLNAHEFFSPTLLDSLKENFGIANAVISYYDQSGNFLSSATIDGRKKGDENHPYTKFIKTDVMHYLIYQEAVRDRLTYFNVVPRIYKSTDVIPKEGYENSGYVNYIKDNYHAHYSLVLAFGINAYIQVTFFRSLEEGDFTEENINDFKQIYVFIANAYMTFKKYEQRLIVSNIQGRIIVSGDKAYIVTDNYHHVMACNDKAQKYVEQLLGYSIAHQIGNMDQSADWLAFLLWDTREAQDDLVQTRIVNNQIYKVHTYRQEYSNGIVDRYHWITISSKNESDEIAFSNSSVTLTKTEQKIAELIYNGMTYQQIADELVVSYHTVKKHVQNIYTKCSVNSRHQLARWIENNERK